MRGKGETKAGPWDRMRRAISRWTDSQFDTDNEYYESGISVVMDFICHGSRSGSGLAGRKREQFPSGRSGSGLAGRKREQFPSGRKEAS